MWLYIVVPLAAGIVAQGLKVLLASGDRRTIGWREVWSSGGMPSMHAAFTVALCAILYLGEGLSAALAASVAFTIVILNDAMVLRRYVGRHGEVLNRLIHRLPDDQEYKYPILTTRVGHTFTEVLGGTLVGLVTALFGYLLFR